MGMKRKKKWMIILTIFIIGTSALGVYIHHIFFPDYVNFTVIHEKELSNPDYGTYIYRGMADQTEYDKKIKQRLFGKTQTGDRIYELKDDPEHQQLILIFNTEMPWWELYELKK